jgi:ubiquinone/menaquinone biosynthesis C-methylase UbiE
VSHTSRALAVVTLLAAVALAGEPFRATADHPFDDVAKWKAVFENPERDAWQKPKELVAALEIAPGAFVADLGAGTGYLLPHLSAAVGPEGAVFAADVEPNLVAHLRERAEKETLASVVPVLASLDDPRLPPKSLDRIVLLDTYHHVDRRLEYLKRLRRALVENGRVAIVDWKEGELAKGPPPDHKIARAEVVEEMTAAGYRLVAEPDFLPFHYFLVFE